MPRLPLIHAPASAVGLPTQLPYCPHSSSNLFVDSKSCTRRCPEPVVGRCTCGAACARGCGEVLLGGWGGSRRWRGERGGGHWTATMCSFSGTCRCRCASPGCAVAAAAAGGDARGGIAAGALLAGSAHAGERSPGENGAGRDARRRRREHCYRNTIYRNTIYPPSCVIISTLSLDSARSNEQFWCTGALLSHLVF